MGLKRIFLSFSLLFLLFSSANAQCKDESGVFKCASLLGDTVVYLNDFNIQNMKIKSYTEDNGESWDIYLIKGNKYRFALCCYEGIDDKEMKLFNKENGEDNPIGSTFTGGVDKAYFDFVCLKSDIYYVSIRFKQNDAESGRKLCAMGLLGYAGKMKSK